MTLSANSAATPPRKILHVDLDAFYAAVEQRDDPSLRGLPVAVAWSESGRGVVLTASYEARPFGVRSAMPIRRALERCPALRIVRPDFAKYRQASRQVREIFSRFTPIVEPLSLDEAYLDVSEDRLALGSAEAIAREIRRLIRETTGLTASAGAAPNKFLAKIASDWRKPDGFFVIKPRQVESFLAPLAVGRLPGVGSATEKRLQALGIATVGALRVWDRAALVGHFGRYGESLWRLCRGIDDSPVEPNRRRKSISAETTFAADRPLAEMAPIVVEQAGEIWAALRRQGLIARTVVVKVRTADFQTRTRSLTPGQPPSCAVTVAAHAIELLDRFGLRANAPLRLCGVGLANLQEPSLAQLALWPAGAAIDDAEERGAPDL
jgi:DNA polymerase-4